MRASPIGWLHQSLHHARDEMRWHRQYGDSRVVSLLYGFAPLVASGFGAMVVLLLLIVPGVVFFAAWWGFGRLTGKIPKQVRAPAPARAVGGSLPTRVKRPETAAATHHPVIPRDRLLGRRSG